MILKLKSKELKEKKKIAKEKEDRDKLLKEWHKYFAWKPTRIDDNQVIWLQWIMRKAKLKYPSTSLDYSNPDLIFEYKLVHEFVAERLRGELDVDQNVEEKKS